MRFVFCLFGALAVTACDSLADVEPYAGVVEVSLAEPGDVADLSLRLVAVEDAGCARPLVTSFERGAATRRVAVEGIGAVDGVVACDGIIPASAVVPLRLGPELPGGFLVEVRHAGATDRYQLDLVSGPQPVLTAVRTSVTRLAE